VRRSQTRPPVDPTDAAAAWSAALRRLSRQPLPRAVLEQRLTRLGYDAAVLAATLDRAQRLGYLDDQAYADSLVRRRGATRGSSLIARELRSKGIGEADVAHALEQVDPAAEEARALALARTSLQRRPPQSSEELRRRVGAVLGRRGYRSGTIVRVLQRLGIESRLAEMAANDVEVPED
jgi:regulatory protein